MRVGQITKKDVLSFEEVRRIGGYNMYSPEAMKMTGLSRPRYLCILENYSVLMGKFSEILKSELYKWGNESEAK